MNEINNNNNNNNYYNNNNNNNSYNGYYMITITILLKCLFPFLFDFK